MNLLRTDRTFRDYLIGRILLLSLALMPPFVVLAIEQQQDAFALGYLIILNGLAGLLSSVFWGRLADRSSRKTIAIACFTGAIAGITLWGGFTFLSNTANSWWPLVMFFMVCISHAGARLGRKTYLVDFANADNRAQLVAVSNTVIGVIMLASGLVGLLAELFSAAITVLVLALVALAAGFYHMRLKEVSA